MVQIKELSEKRLDENKYDLYNAVKHFLGNLNNGKVVSFIQAFKEDIPRLQEIVKRIEKL